MTALLLAGMLAAQPVQPGLWRVHTLIQGAATSEVRLICYEPRDPWLPLLVPIFGDGPCQRPTEALMTGSLDVKASCAASGSLSVSGMVQSDRFEIVAHRSGRVGINPNARASLTSSGKLIDPSCGEEE